MREFRLITTLFELDPDYWKKIQSEKRGPKKGAVYSKCRNCMEEFPNMKELDRHLATHGMARANLNKNKVVCLTKSNTTTASKYKPKRHRICCIN